jgi:hypothetical protein
MQPVRLAAMIAAALVSAGTLTACTGGSATPEPAPAPTQSLYTPPPCPTPAKAIPTNWPKFLPSDLPRPKNATIMKNGVSTTSDGVHIVRFTTPTSLRESVLFIVKKYRDAGYVLGRGDAEATEADAPFVHGSIRGVTRISRIEQCQTLWLTATVKVDNSGSTTPLISPHPTSTGSPSPLPFG